MREFAHAYLGEVSHKLTIYKGIFNLEKLGSYQLEEETGSLEDL